MYYYSLEKYYKKSESLNIASPTETLKKVLAPSDLPHNEPELNLPRSRKEKSNITTGLNKELFKRIRVINPDFSEALETVFSYQFTLNGFTLELVKMFEKIAHSLGNVMKPGGPDNTAPQKHMRSPSMVTSPSCKTVKYPLEMEVNSILYNVQKLHEELFSLVTEVIPKREKSLSKGRPARGSNAATPSEMSSSKKRQSIPIIAETTKPLNKSSVASKRPSKMQTSKTKVNLHELFEQDQKENNEASQLMSSSSSSRNLNLQPMNSLSQLKVSVARNVPSSTRNSTNNKDNRILGKRGVNLSTGPLEATSTILTDLKNESKRNISDKFSGKLELDILPKKELEDEDETISLTSGIPTCENLQTVGNQKSPLETTLCKTLATKARDEHVEITKKEKNVIKHLLSAQNRAMNSPSKRGDQPLLCQKRYLIGAKWWTAWKEYVNFDSNVADESKCLAQVYPRPGMIINHDLLNQEDMNKDSLDSSSIGLKDHLLEHHDFEAVSKEVFEILAIWYGCDYEVIRLLRPDPSHPDRFFLDLFPKRRLRRTANQKSMPDNLLLMKK